MGWDSYCNFAYPWWCLTCSNCAFDQLQFIDSPESRETSNPREVDKSAGSRTTEPEDLDEIRLLPEKAALLFSLWKLASLHTAESQENNSPMLIIPEADQSIQGWILRINFRKQWQDNSFTFCFNYPSVQYGNKLHNNVNINDSDTLIKFFGKIKLENQLVLKE